MRNSPLEECLTTGYRLGSLFKGSSIIVGDSGHPLVKPYTLSLISGAAATGARIFFRHGIPLPYACFATKWLRAKATVYLNQPFKEGIPNITVLKNGEQAIKISKRKPSLDWKIAESFQELPDLTSSYISKLLEIAGHISTPTMVAAAIYEGCLPLLPTALSRMGFKVTTIALPAESSLDEHERYLREIMKASQSALGFLLDPSATEIRILDQRGKQISPSTRALLILNALLKRGLRSFSIPSSLAQLSTHIKALGGIVKEYSQGKPPSRRWKNVDAIVTADYHVILRGLPWIDSVLECLLVASEAASGKSPNNLENP